jgi:Mg-chelatase subunit ChlI
LIFLCPSPSKIQAAVAVIHHRAASSSELHPAPFQSPRRREAASTDSVLAVDAAIQGRIPLPPSCCRVADPLDHRSSFSPFPSTEKEETQKNAARDKNKEGDEENQKRKMKKRRKTERKRDQKKEKEKDQKGHGPGKRKEEKVKWAIDPID